MICCEECCKYEDCAKSDRLRENCCPQCAEYHDCAALDTREEKTSYRTLYVDEYNEEVS